MSYNHINTVEKDKLFVQRKKTRTFETSLYVMHSGLEDLKETCLKPIVTKQMNQRF